MRANYVSDVERIGNSLAAYEKTFGALPGIVEPAARASLIDQIVDSEQRVMYFERLRTRRLDPSSIDPASSSFDPLKASLVHQEAGEYDEAVWLVFLFVHFGKHLRAGWRYVRDVYGRLGQGALWDWEATSADPTAFRFWLDSNQDSLAAGDGPRGFGNHRKYESLDAWSDAGTGTVVESYVDWVLASGGDHEQRFDAIRKVSPQDGFDQLYRSMSAVARFGRIARFDYLNTLRNMGLLNVSPPHAYLVGATGPLRGARLLFNNDMTEGSARELQTALSQLTESTALPPNILEDAVCNWQKSPMTYVRFSG